MYVFVYGTLTDPDRVQTVLEGHPTAEYALEETATLEGVHRVDGRYPTLAPGGSVDGRVLAVDEVGLERLDRYEGVEDGLYVRVTVPYSGRDDEAFVYVGDPARLGVDDRIDWPGDGPLLERVRRVVREDEIVLSSRE
ncbi:gamma-glutamylcyclotransferase family protein [Natronobacterium texcoconense]|uniref:Gamma-glutamyl cyclotransferase, AIG2-like n=1 Tax=Natronobacterium texcoconense TaxID=1095778 RepID=A0A1H1ICP2_NATTX|nr:gamma-glutamylcyclotransferase family protein [Natronobacterium texcoconense]SDR35451.1 Gamma-glutamyl cyclotransferase, AIG2-like [Natronobacterium texcoconense]